MINNIKTETLADEIISINDLEEASEIEIDELKLKLRIEKI